MFDTPIQVILTPIPCRVVRASCHVHILGARGKVALEIPWHGWEKVRLAIRSTWHHELAASLVVPSFKRAQTATRVHCRVQTGELARKVVVNAQGGMKLCKELGIGIGSVLLLRLFDVVHSRTHGLDGPCGKGSQERRGIRIIDLHITHHSQTTNRQAIFHRHHSQSEGGGGVVGGGQEERHNMRRSPSRTIAPYTKADVTIS